MNNRKPPPSFARIASAAGLFALVCVIAFGMAAFGSATTDFTQWHEGVRWMVALAGGLFGSIAAATQVID